MAFGAPPQRKPFDWHDPGELTRLLQPYGFTLSLEEHELAFTAASAQGFLDQQAKDHPLAVAGLGILAKLGQAELVRNEPLAILESGNEDPLGFRATSRYDLPWVHFSLAIASLDPPAPDLATRMDFARWVGRKNRSGANCGFPPSGRSNLGIASSRFGSTNRRSAGARRNDASGARQSFRNAII
jgi:hypothetical protein